MRNALEGSIQAFVLVAMYFCVLYIKHPMFSLTEQREKTSTSEHKSSLHKEHIEKQQEQKQKQQPTFSGASVLQCQHCARAATYPISFVNAYPRTSVIL